MDITLGARDERTGRFNFVRDPVTRDVAFDDTEAHAVMCSALEDLEGYWADSTHGSELYKLDSLTQRTPSVAEAATLASLDRLEQQGRITDVSADAAAVTGADGLNRLRIDLHWKSRNGSTQSNDAEV